MVVQEVIRKSAEFFHKKGIPSARLDAELLVAEALGWRRLDVFLRFDFPLGEEEVQRCRELVARRGKGEPVAYIRKKKEFFKSEFYVDAGVLIPRPETEGLVLEAIAYLKQREIPHPRILDMGCGSGCIGLSLIKELPEARLLGIDLSEAALRVSRKNAETLGVLQRSEFSQLDAGKTRISDVIEMLGGSPDLIVANPPYIAPEDPMVESGVRDFEPAEALFSEDDGLRHIREWTLTANQLLENSGMFLCEMGTGQGERVLEVAKRATQFSSLVVLKDEAGHDRILKAIK